MIPEKSKTSGVADYYNKNTRRFLRLGQGGKQLSIHRAVWGPGVADRQSAFHYVHNSILKTIQEIRPKSVIDLGCGIGGSMIYLAEKTAPKFIGVTISSIQKEIGAGLMKEKNLSDRCTIFHHDFSDAVFIGELVKKKSEKPLLVFCIESFVHAIESDRFVRDLSRFLTPGDVLIICDDFLTKTGGEPNSEKKKRLLREFKQGWKIGTLLEIGSVRKLGDKYGFDLQQDENLTMYLEIGRPRDVLIRILIRLLKIFLIKAKFTGSSWLDNLIGGNALQKSIRTGLIEYHFLVFQKI